MDAAISNKGNLNEEYNQKVLSEVHSDLANMVEYATEVMIDISKKRIALHGDHLWHEYRRHIKTTDEQARHQIPFSLEQFKEAIEAIYSPDLVECVFNTPDNPIEQRSFAYAKKSSNGYYVVVEVIGGKRNPNIVPVMILQFDETKWNNMMTEGKTLGELFYENDTEMAQCLDIAFNKKNRVTAAQFASSEAIANTLRSPRSNNSITEKGEKDNSFDENNSKKFSDERKSVKRSYEPGGESSKKITLGMSDAERTEILKNKSIKLSAETNNERIEQAQEKHEFTEESFNLANFADKRDLVIKVGDEFGVFKNYHNEDIELSFQYSKNNAREGMVKQKKQYYDFVKMLSCFDSVIENAVGIEMHNRNSEGYKKDNTLKNMYVLASAFVDGDYIVPVKLEIKEFSDKPSSLYVAIALERISLETIKKDGVVAQEVADSSVAQQVTRPSNISIAEYFKNINPKDESFYKYIPKPFLNGDIDTDERKSVKRSYNPFEDIDDEGNKFVEGEDGGTRILFSMPDFDNPAYEYGHIPDEEPDILETYKAVVSSSTEADLRKRLADATKMKVYARKEAKSAFDEIITERGYFEGLNVKFKGKSRTEIEKMLWNALNSADEGARMGPALDIAEAIITNAGVTENYEMTPELELAYAITGYLKTHFHDLTNF